MSMVKAQSVKQNADYISQVKLEEEAYGNMYEISPIELTHPSENWELRKQEG